jgi:hypothetical protein
MALGSEPELEERIGDYALHDHADRHLTVGGIKLWLDGALGSRGAWLLEPYADSPESSGLNTVPLADARRVADIAARHDLQLCVHAIGDRANREVLDALERIAPDYPDNPGRHRLEHAQILSPADIPRFAALGVIAAMQPIHATSDMYWADERLGEERLEGAYAWQSLADHGAHLALGSDFPVEAVNPFLGLYAAVTRQDLEGWPEGGWQPQERLTREQALRGFTLDAAYAAFMENEVGSLEPGKQADFIVIDRDIMTVPPEEIATTVVLETWVGGKRVFKRN